MTVKSKPKSRWEKFVVWDDRRRFGAEVTLSDIKKLEKLDRILRKDMGSLGIKPMSIFMETKKSKATSAHSQVLRIKGKDKKRYPSKLVFDHQYIHGLNVQELRSIGWHELGHYIFAYYYPEIMRRYNRPEQYEIAETFADEFAYRKFGDIYVKATKKSIKAIDPSYGSYHIKALKKMKKYITQHGYGYWIEVAKECNVPIKYDPKNTTIIGVKPKKGVLGNLK